jgi:serine/threonine protein kinase
MAGQPKATVSSSVCAVCGKALPANAPGGLCPACLLGRGIELATRASAKPGDFIPPAPDELAVLFPEFEIVSLIGRGGMGAVYRAVQTELDRTVAIKLLPPETARDAEFMERFRREATTLARLDHPCVVRLFDYGQRDDFAYFVMEFVDGVDLAQRMSSGPMSPEEAFAVVSQLCDALQHSHERGVIHRDIKPANILIARDGRVKLADFGLARLVHPDFGDPGLTRTHARLGTLRYMAPEQMSGAGTADHRVDVYALGVVLYEMLTAHLPAGRFDPPSEKIPALTPRLDNVVLQALSADPERRFASMAEVKARLGEAIAHPGLTRLERRRQLGSRAFLASLFAAAVGVAAAWLWSARRGNDAGAQASVAPSAPLSLPAGRLEVFSTMPSPLANQPVSAVAVAGALNEFALALRPDGMVQGWGDNRFGQTDVPAGLSGVVAIAAGQGARTAHVLALRTDGTVAGWGDNTFNQASPPPGLSNAVAIAAGEFHSLALTRDGRVVAWGHRSSPALAVPENLPRVKAIAAGADFSLALLNEGRVVAWGLNDAGQCQVPQVSALVVKIVAGSGHALAQLDDGQVIAWGDNGAKQCDVPADLSAVTAVFAGGEGSAAVDQSGKLYVWGKVPPNVRSFSDRVASVAIGSSTWILIVLESSAEFSQ